MNFRLLAMIAGMTALVSSSLQCSALLTYKANSKNKKLHLVIVADTDDPQQAFVNTLKGVLDSTETHQLTCFLEFPSSDDGNVTLERHSSVKTLLNLDKIIPVKADERSLEGNFLFSCAQQLYEHSLDSTLTFAALQSIADCLFPTAYSRPTINNYLESLKRDLLFLHELEKKYEQNLYFAGYIKNRIRSFIQAQSEISTLLSAHCPQTSICKFFRNQVQCCQSAELTKLAITLLNLYAELSSPLLIGGILHRIIDHTETNERMCLVVVEKKHLPELVSRLKNLGFILRGQINMAHETTIAFVSRWLLSAATQFCWYCFQKTQLKGCTLCKSALYCGVECQKKDWAKHQTLCKTLRDTAHDQ